MSCNIAGMGMAKNILKLSAKTKGLNIKSLTMPDRSFYASRYAEIYEDGYLKLIFMKEKNLLITISRFFMCLFGIGG